MLSKTAEYALRVAVCLAQSPDKLAAADELAEVTKIPRRYLHKVVQDLARGDWFVHSRGPVADIRSPSRQKKSPFSMS